MANISKGSYASDGLRVGPTFNNPQNNNPVIINPGQAVPVYAQFSGNNNLDQGVLLAPWNVYSITPNAPGNTFTQFNNLAALRDFAAAGYFTLLGDNSVTTLISSPQGNNEVVFDWPRAVTATTDGTVGNVVLTIFGLDYLGFPLQATLNFTGSTGVTTLTTLKAFKVVTAAYSNLATTGITQISLGASATVFGLPYAITDYSYVQAYWSGLPIQQQTGISQALNGTTSITITPAGGVLTGSSVRLDGFSPAGTAGAPFLTAITPTTGTFTIASTSGTDTSTVRWTLSSSLVVAYKLADPSTATNTTGDVRGTVTTSTPAISGTSVLTVYMNVQGANNWINQQAALNQPGQPPVNSYVPLVAANLIGVPQYYTGITA